MATLKRHGASAGLSLALVALVGAMSTASFGCGERAVHRHRHEPIAMPTADVATVALGTSARAQHPAPAPFPPAPPPGCATLREVATSDTVRVEGGTIFYADATAGLTIVDATDAANPSIVAKVPFRGAPVALFVREGIAWSIVTDSDADAGKPQMETVVRAFDVRVPGEPRLIGTQIRNSAAHDAKLVDGLLYVMRASGPASVVEAFGIEKTKLALLDSVELTGAPAQLAASVAGLAAVTVAADRATLAWLELSMERRGSIAVLGTVSLPGGVSAWGNGEGTIVDADEGQRVRLVTCATAACSPDDAAFLRIVDFSGDTPAKSIKSLRLTEHEPVPTTRFADGLLYIAERPASSDESSALRVVLTDVPVPRFGAAHVAMLGRISALVAHGDALVALGTVTSGATQQMLVMNDIDVRRPDAPKARSTLLFGSDWTWSPVAHEANAMSFDPSSHLVAVPFTAWRREDMRYVAGAQLMDLEPAGPEPGPALDGGGWVERAVFLGGRLVMLGPTGVSSVEIAPHGHSNEDVTQLGR
jgi:hypothetical protein